MKSSGKNNFLIDGFPRNRDNLDGWNSQVAKNVNMKFVLFFECDNNVRQYSHFF
jgi:UMP-CMP kinase